MNQITLKEKLATITRSIHQYERILRESAIFQGQVTPFKSPKLQIAFNELQTARMFAGDCLRLVVLEKDWRLATRFIPKEHGGTWEQEIDLPMPPAAENHDPKQVEQQNIFWLKEQLREVFYQSIDLINNTPHLPCEFWFYNEQTSVSLKKADQQLGLRIGELQ